MMKLLTTIATLLPFSVIGMAILFPYTGDLIDLSFRAVAMCYLVLMAVVRVRS